MFSLLVSNQASGYFKSNIKNRLYNFNKAKDAFIQDTAITIYRFLRSKKIIYDKYVSKIYSEKEIRSILLNLSTRFFKHYAERKTYEEIPLLTSDNSYTWNDEEHHFLIKNM